MSFRISLGSKNGVELYLVIVNDQININFIYEKDVYSAQEEMEFDNFVHLLMHFDMPNEVPFVCGERSEHIKRHHSHEEDIYVTHTHMSFNQEVTPEILRGFLEGILGAQQHPRHSSNPDSQFVTRQAAVDTLAAFTSFYKEFAKSPLKTQFLAERQLDKTEQRSLVNFASKGKLPLADNDKAVLAKGINAEPNLGKLGLFRIPGNQEQSSTYTSCNICTIM